MTLPFLDQNLTPLRMAHLFFSLSSYMLKIQVECKLRFGELLYALSYTYIILDLRQNQVHHWQEH
jgi:hypothetical protein